VALFLDELGVRQPYCRPFLDFEQLKEKNDSERMRQVRNHTGSIKPADRQREQFGPSQTSPKNRRPHDKSC
jgi:hypothetical protein